MKQRSLTLVLAVMISLFIYNSLSLAQDEGHFYTVTTWKMMVPTDGSNAELNDLFKEWYDKVVSKNDKIVSEKVFTHISGADMRDWVVISEYATWNDMNEANDVQNKLVAEGWPNEDDRKEFFATFWKYVYTHSDEILQEVPALTK